MPCECGLERCVYFDCEIKDAVVDPKRIRKLEKDFSKEDWKWDSLDLEEDAFFADVTFTLTEKNELKQILPRMWDWCCVSRDTIIFSTELSKALKEGSIILKFYFSEDFDSWGLNPWGLKIEPNKVQLLKMELVPVREVTEKEDIWDLLQSLELPRFENPEEANIFFFKKIDEFYSRVYEAILCLIKEELRIGNPEATRENAEEFFVSLWNSFIDHGVPKQLSTKIYPARSVLLVKLMNDIKKEV